MWPALRSGDEAGFAPLEGLPSAGDVVIARLPGTSVLVIHRVVRVAAGELTLRGDSCLREDAPVRLEDTLGRVTAVRRRGKLLREGAWDRGPRWLGTLKTRVGGGLRRMLRRGP